MVRDTFNDLMGISNLKDAPFQVHPDETAVVAFEKGKDVGPAKKFGIDLTYGTSGKDSRWNLAARSIVEQAITDKIRKLTKKEQSSYQSKERQDEFPGLIRALFSRALRKIIVFSEAVQRDVGEETRRLGSDIDLLAVRQITARVVDHRISEGKKYHRKYSRRPIVRSLPPFLTFTVPNPSLRKRMCAFAWQL